MTRDSIHELRLTVDRAQKPYRREANLFYNKMGFKKFLNKNGVRVPETYLYSRDPAIDLSPIKELDSFVIKPNGASSGADVYVLEKTKDGKYLEIDGRVHPWEFIEGKSRQILGIPRSGGLVIEERIYSSPDRHTFISKGLNGLVDYRFFVLANKPLYAKIRVPSEQSGFYSNTCRGAVALFMNKDGVISKDNIFRNTTTIYGKKDLEGVKVPYWDELYDEVVRISELFKLPFHSVDICLGDDGKFTVLESEAIPYLGYLNDGPARDLDAWIKHVIDVKEVEEGK